MGEYAEDLRLSCNRDTPVCDIEVEHILQILKPIWTRKHETARRVRMRIECVLDSAKVLKLRERDNPAIWRGGLKSLLPKISASKRVRRHPAMPWKKYPLSCQS